jgi:hypothetical protein
MAKKGAYGSNRKAHPVTIKTIPIKKVKAKR